MIAGPAPAEPLVPGGTARLRCPAPPARPFPGSRPALGLHVPAGGADPLTPARREAYFTSQLINEAVK
ncbi:hypothetical protein Ate01nite_17330 [Actinoplanes teichomyceticus]|nr:hypothetical protein Ate01nite_17330 [Actinoplanes teichomyceticus]